MPTLAAVKAQLYETRNTWQSLACSPPGIAVLPPSERSYPIADRRLLFTVNPRSNRINVRNMTYQRD